MRIELFIFGNVYVAARPHPKHKVCCEDPAATEVPYFAKRGQVSTHEISAVLLMILVYSYFLKSSKINFV